MFITVYQLSNVIKRCKNLQEECKQYPDKPDYCLHHHRFLLEKCVLAFEELKYVHKKYEECRNIK